MNCTAGGYGCTDLRARDMQRQHASRHDARPSSAATCPGRPEPIVLRR